MKYGCALRSVAGPRDLVCLICVPCMYDRIIEMRWQVLRNRGAIDTARSFTTVLARSKENGLVKTLSRLSLGCDPISGEVSARRCIAGPLPCCLRWFCDPCASFNRSERPSTLDSEQVRYCDAEFYLLMIYEKQSTAASRLSWVSQPFAHKAGIRKLNYSRSYINHLNLIELDWILMIDVEPLWAQ
jgi:hypothetical protein